MPAKGQIIDRTGQVFNDWTFIKLVGINKHGEATWLCRCKCGRERHQAACNITSGNSKRCSGCAAEKLKKPIENQLPLNMWKRILKRHKDVEITRDEAYRLFLQQKKYCALSGLPIQFAKTASEIHLQTASLDRIDSSKGYIRGNIQWVHKDINVMKNIFSQGYFIDLCRYVHNHNEEPEYN